MIKKIFAIALPLMAATTFVACSGEEDDLFSSSAAERLNAASELYSARLTAQPNGWAMQYYPTYDNEAPNGKGYLLLTRFNPDFTVDVSGYEWPDWRYETVGASIDASSTRDWVIHYIEEYRESSSYWEVITDNGPVLSFNTGNVGMHYFSDPDQHETGTGFGGDYEFIVVDAPDDASYMMLKGKKRGTYNLLTPIEEGVVYADYMADVKNFHNQTFIKDELASCLIHFGDSVYRMDGANDGLPNIYPYDGDPITNENFNPFLITKRGNDYYLRFRDAFERDDMEGVLQDLRFDAEKQEFVGTDNADFRITPYPVGQFFVENMQSLHKWQTSLVLVKSPSVADLFSRMVAQLASNNPKYEIAGPNDAERTFDLSYAADQVNLTFKVKFKRGTRDFMTDLKYGYSIERNGNEVTLTYQGGLTDASNTIYDNATMSTVKELVDLFADTFTVHGAITDFDLHEVRLTAKNNPEKWFDLQYKN